MPRKKPVRPVAPEVCPVCGEDVPRNSLACPECGSDHETGWREGSAVYDGLNLPDDDFNYDEFVNEEFGSSPKPAGLRPLWWIAGLVLVAILAWALLGQAHW